MIEQEDMPDRMSGFWIYIICGWALFLIGSLALFIVALWLGSIWWIGGIATGSWAIKLWWALVGKIG